MMSFNRGVIFLFFLSVALGVNANDVARLDSLLQVLDRTIEYRSDYTERKEQLISSLKKELEYTTVEEQRFNLTEKIFLLYGNYQLDSALLIAQQRIDIAHKLKKPEFIAKANMNMAAALRTIGMYKETFEILDYIREEDLAQYDIGYFWHLYHSLYILMRDYSVSDQDKTRYNTFIYNYKDSILSITPPSDIDFYLVNSTKNIMLGEYDKALHFMDEAYKLNRQRAMVTYTMSEIYKHMGEPTKEKIYLAESAIADLKSGVKEYISLQELAIILFAEGDIDRAYLYVKTSMEDAIFSNARLRALEISRMLPIINKTYDIKMKQEKTRLLRISIIAVVLALILLATLIYLYRQVKALSSIRKYQKKMNVDLKDMNGRLNATNSELKDANLIKEEYIGYLFNICSSYIDKLENYRVTVNRKIKTGQIEDLNKMTSSSSLVADEQKEFYKNFDTIFLNLFPSFVEDFNEMLLEGNKIEPKEGELLTPELRIFALIRLGINDSVKIAKLLRYSPQTIYNYRFKIRHKLAISKEEFPQKLTQIGLLSL